MWGSVKNLPEFKICDSHCSFPAHTCYSSVEVVLLGQYFFWPICLLFISLPPSERLQIVWLFFPEFLQQPEVSQLLHTSCLSPCLSSGQYTVFQYFTLPAQIFKPAAAGSEFVLALRVPLLSFESLAADSSCLVRSHLLLLHSGLRSYPFSNGVS